jgi:ATP-dependent DNA ligase
VFPQVLSYGAFEGIVAKRRDSHYRSGRCTDWINVKNPQHPAIARAELIVLSKRRNQGDRGLKTR